MRQWDSAKTAETGFCQFWRYRCGGYCGVCGVERQLFSIAAVGFMMLRRPVEIALERGLPGELETPDRLVVVIGGESNSVPKGSSKASGCCNLLILLMN
jgi:hypothetical protein